MGETLPVAFSGEPGAFAEDAVIAYFDDAPRLPVPGFRDVFEAVRAGRARAGAIPIENRLNGTVRENYDLLLEYDLAIVGEAIVPVRLCLAALPGQTLDAIERVYSHIQALGQAEAFLRTRPWTLLTTYNTAGAAKLIVERGELGAAAVVSPRAAGLFGLEILADGLASDDNRTRFVIVVQSHDQARSGPSAESAGEPWRATVAFAVRNEPGTLLQALRCFAERGVNLSTLESRPFGERAWEYVFWADIDAAADEAACAAAIGELRERATMVRVLGTYPQAVDTTP